MSLEKLKNALVKFPIWQEVTEELKTQESRLLALINEKAKLGLFAMKRKKEIDEEIRILESKESELKSKKQSIEEETLGYKLRASIEKDIEKTQSAIQETKLRIEEAKIIPIKSEILAELKKEPIGKKLYEKYENEQKIEQMLAKTFAKWSKARVGNTVKFGRYYQSNKTTKEDIEWQVLAKEGNKLLLISKYALDCKRYNTSKVDVTWETCTLRKWLNNGFINEAFNEDEKLLIPTVTVSADKNPNYSTNTGNSTQDKVFLLSIPEADKYFSRDKLRQCKPTAYAIEQGVYTDSACGGTCRWWLRSPGLDNNYASYVDYAGSASTLGNPVNYGGGFFDTDIGAVRPALWVNLE